MEPLKIGFENMTLCEKCASESAPPSQPKEKYKGKFSELSGLYLSVEAELLGAPERCFAQETQIFQKNALKITSETIIFLAKISSHNPA